MKVTVTYLLVVPVVLPKTNPHVKYQCYTMSSTWEMDLKRKTLTESLKRKM